MRSIVALISAMLVAVLATTGIAQETAGNIDGRLVDAEGDAVKFANVMVSGPAIADTRSVMSSSVGEFVIASLPPGVYTVRVFHISYNQFIQKDVTVAAGEATRLGDLVLTEGVIEVSPIIVTASRTEQPLETAPAAMTVLNKGLLEQLPTDDYQDVFRLAPGMNVAMMSAGDISINARRATGVIATGTLAMIDSRTIYNDFNGQVWWNSTPMDPGDIKQVEIQRGPGSAVWGANAMDGVVNIITKPPKEMRGVHAMLGGGNLETRYGNLTYAGVRDRIGYKLTGGYYEQKEPYERPTGSIPGTEGPLNPGGTQYPPYPSQGTEQLKFNARIDYDQSEKTTWSLSGGYGGFEGLLLTPGGPATFDDGSFSAYGKAQWSRQAAEVNLYVNYLESPGIFLLNGVDSYIETRMVNLDFKNNQLIGERNLLTYGANVRHSEFEVTLTPNAPDRDEFGAFVQDQIRFSQYFSGILGARVDDIDPMGTKVSPRAAVLFSPVPGNTIRIAYNRAFRAPTTIENYITFPQMNVITIPNPGPGPLTIDLFFPLNTVPNTDLSPEELDSFELGWVGVWDDRIECTVTGYYNELENAIRNMPVEFYSSANPPPGWMLPDSLLDIPPPNGFAGTRKLRAWKRLV